MDAEFKKKKFWLSFTYGVAQDQTFFQEKIAKASLVVAFYAITYMLL